MFLKSFLNFTYKYGYSELVRTSVLCETRNLLRNFYPIGQQPIVRWKSRKSKGEKNNDEEDSDDSDEEPDFHLGKGVEVKTNVVGSMRADLLLKTGLGIARNKVEEAFYESRIRVNSKKIFKKSVHVNVGDELDIIKGISPSNASFLTVGRLEILGAKARHDNEGIEVKMRRSKTIVIDNYPDGDPWKQIE